MEFSYFNPNPCGRTVGDCAVRAIAKALDMDWGQAFAILASFAYSMCDMPNADEVWGAVLRAYGFVRFNIPEGITVEDIVNKYPSHICVIGFGRHVSTIRNGILYDAWNSSRETPLFVWVKEELNAVLQ